MRRRFQQLFTSNGLTRDDVRGLNKRTSAASRACSRCCTGYWNVNGLRWSRLHVVLVVLAAFTLGLYLSGMLYVLFDLAWSGDDKGFSQLDVKDFNVDQGSHAAGEEADRAELKWEKKYKELLKLNPNVVVPPDDSPNAEAKKPQDDEINPRKQSKRPKPRLDDQQKDDSQLSRAESEAEKLLLKQKSDLLMQSDLSSKKGEGEDVNKTGLNDDDGEGSTAVSVFDMLPSSSVWCKGDNLYNRVCKFRNLCYNEKHKKWFIVRTNSSVLDNYPADHVTRGLLEAGTVETHPWVRFNVDEVSPFWSSFRKIPVRYETELTIMARRLHPHNIMHNLHDDLIPLFYLITEYVGNGDLSLDMPFSLHSHRMMFIDGYEDSDSTRPLQYLSNKRLRFMDYLERSNKRDTKGITTCFRDAVVGTSKLTTWYQYGFVEPQGPIPGKFVNGLLIRKVAEWFVRRIGLPMGEDELWQRDSDEWSSPGSAAAAALASNKHQASQDSTSHASASDASIDFPETDIIVILSRRRNRLIINEDDLAAHLTKVFGLEVVLVRNENHNFEAQVEYMRRARVVLGMHGSILIMGMFCRRGTVMIELFPFAVPAENYTPYKTMCQLSGMDIIYRAWENKHPNTSITHDDAKGILGGINHLPQEEQDAIRNSTTVPPHICCMDAYWLYRIYQDTIVNLTEVSSMISEALVESRALLRRIRGVKVGDRLKHKWNWEAIIMDPSIAPPPIPASDVTCVNDSRREPGSLWVAWDKPWSGVPVSKWEFKVVKDEFTDAEALYLTDKPEIYIRGFKPLAEISFQIRAMNIDGVDGEFGQIIYCVV